MDDFKKKTQIIIYWCVIIAMSVLLIVDLIDLKFELFSILYVVFLVAGIVSLYRFKKK